MLWIFHLNFVGGISAAYYSTSKVDEIFRNLIDMQSIFVASMFQVCCRFYPLTSMGKSTLVQIHNVMLQILLWITCRSAAKSQSHIFTPLTLFCFFLKSAGKSAAANSQKFYIKSHTIGCGFGYLVLYIFLRKSCIFFNCKSGQKIQSICVQCGRTLRISYFIIMYYSIQAVSLYIVSTQSFNEMTASQGIMQVLLRALSL